jgi:hypothetical protein
MNKFILSIAAILLYTSSVDAGRVSGGGGPKYDESRALLELRFASPNLIEGLSRSKVVIENGSIINFSDIDTSKLDNMLRLNDDQEAEFGVTITTPILQIKKIEFEDGSILEINKDIKNPVHSGIYDWSE